MDFENVKKYWDERAAHDSSAQSTTQDYYLREIEHAVLLDLVREHSGIKIADIGCGDGRTTARLAEAFPDASFVGFDYSPSMISNARCLHGPGEKSNLTFHESDICNGLTDTFDVIYTTRCLINLPSWDLQKLAISNIRQALQRGGRYLMIENFVEGQDQFNHVRKQFGLPEIPIREHNKFFERQQFFEYVSELFDVEKEINISSSYYLVTRVIYSKMCAELDTQPNYFDDHHRLAAQLPFCGEFGPVRMICLRNSQRGNG